MCYRCDKEGHTAPYCTAPLKVKETNGGKKPDCPSETKTSGRDEPRISLIARREYYPIHGQETEAYVLTTCLIDQNT